MVEAVMKTTKAKREMIELIITDQFENMVKAFKTCASVEMSGFGTFHFLVARGKKQRVLLDKMIKEGRYTQAEVENMKKDIVFIETQLAKCHKSNK